jgi:hypothetical protein
MELSWLVPSPSYCCPRIPYLASNHLDAEAVSHLFVISRLASVGREHCRKRQTHRGFWISLEMVINEEEEPAPAS